MEPKKRRRSCRRCVYYGRVQGVGFRYTTVSIAKRYAVFGYVKNLPDGTVELVVEAERKPMEQFLTEIARYFSANIVECSHSDLDSGQGFRSFEVRY